MAKLRVLSGEDVAVLLEHHGFARTRQRGSHVVLQRREAGTTTTVVVPLHGELRIGTLLSVIRQSKLDRSLFEA